MRVDASGHRASVPAVELCGMHCATCDRTVESGKICPDCFTPLADAPASRGDEEETYRRLKQAAAPLRRAPIPVRAAETLQPARPPEASPASKWWGGLAAAGVLVAAVLLWPRTPPRPAAPVPTLAHARELVNQKAYAEAVKEGKALLQRKPAEARAVRELIAQAAASGGLWEEAVAQYKLLGNLKELRKAQGALGAQKLEAARQALAAGNVVAARDLGKQALGLLKSGQASQARLATTYAILGQATYLLDQLPASRDYLTQAVALAPADATSRTTLAKVRTRLTPAPPPPPVADYVPPSTAGQETVIVVPSSTQQSAYPTYQPKPRLDDESYGTVPRAYPTPYPATATYPSSSSTSSTRRRSRPTAEPTPTSRVGQLRQSESLLHRYR